MKSLWSRKGLLVAVAVISISLLSGCLVSNRVTVDAVTSGGIVRCTQGQSLVMESTDENALAYGAATGQRRDALCANEDPPPLWWNYIDAGASKYMGNYLCGTATIYYTTSNRSVSTTGNALCNNFFPAPGVFVVGLHGSKRPGDNGPPRRENSFTASVTSY